MKRKTIDKPIINIEKCISISYFKLLVAQIHLNSTFLNLRDLRDFCADRLPV